MLMELYVYLGAMELYVNQGAMLDNMGGLADARYNGTLVSMCLVSRRCSGQSLDFVSLPCDITISMFKRFR